MTSSLLLLNRILPSSFGKLCSAVSEKSKMSQPIKGQGGHLVFPISLKNTSLVEHVEFLVSVKLWQVLFIGFREVKYVLSLPISGQGGHLVFPISPKNTKLVEDVEFLLPVKFGHILFFSYREEVLNVTANQRPGHPSCFPDQPQKIQTW